ncbi:unannotated protein [freshwater metagenome]|uniref:Unannotated protein n=1 Tax=freshwater metagenome TaxID=449393 RepID=A0A6J6V0L3_9ZZZZ
MASPPAVSSDDPDHEGDVARVGDLPGSALLLANVLLLPFD